MGRGRHSPLWPERDPQTQPQIRILLATRTGSGTGHRGRARPPHCQRPRIEKYRPASPGADGLERQSSGESQVLIRGFKKWPRNQQIALPILSVFAFGALFNQMQARKSEPVSIHVENPRIIDGDTLETLDKKRVRLSGIDAPDEDGKGNVPKIAAQLYLEELVKQNGGMDCTSDFQDEKLTIEPICNTRRTSWGRSNLSCRFQIGRAHV